MPFKSQAQRAKFYAMAERGEMPMATVERWEKETKKKKLPKRIKAKKSRKKAKRSKKFTYKSKGKKIYG